MTSTLKVKQSIIDIYTRRQINLYRMFLADFSVNSQPILMKFCKDYLHPQVTEYSNLIGQLQDSKEKISKVKLLSKLVIHYSLTGISHSFLSGNNNIKMKIRRKSPTVNAPSEFLITMTTDDKN